MIITLKSATCDNLLQSLLNSCKALQIRPILRPGIEPVEILLLGKRQKIAQLVKQYSANLEPTQAFSTPYTLANRLAHPHDTVIDCADITIGGHRFTLIADLSGIPDPTERSQLEPLSQACGLHITIGSNLNHGLIVQEISTVANIEESHMDDETPQLFQVSAENMHNHDLLSALGRCTQPIILRRSCKASIDQWLLSAEILLNAGNEQVILCEQGIFTHNQQQPMLDLGAIALIKQVSHLPIIVDPGFSATHANLIQPLAQAAIACGADGFIIRVKGESCSNAKHGSLENHCALNLQQLRHLVRSILPFVEASGRELP